MAKKKTLIDELKNVEDHVQIKRDLIGKLSEPIQAELRLIMQKFNRGELKDKFPSRTALANWIYKTMRKNRPDEFPAMRDTKYFGDLLARLNA